MKTKVKLLICTFLFLFVTGLHAQVPTLWRGPHGNGVYDETGLLKSWPAQGPEILWSFDKLGAGFSSPVAVNNKIYISGSEEGLGYVYALSNDGKFLWKTQYGPEFTESYPGSRSTPVVAGDLLYQYSGQGLVTCMDASTGKIKWQKDVMKEFGGRNLQWACTETFALDGEKLFVTPGGLNNTVIALNRMTGSLIWSSSVKGELSAYCSPLIVKIQGRTLLVTHLESDIACLDANTGKLLWTYPHPNQWSVHANTPIYQDGSVFCFSGYGQGGVKLKLSPDGSSVSTEWVSKLFDGRIGGAVLVNGFLYGSGDNNRYWMCLDWKTGELKYKAAGLASGNVIYADGMLYGYTDRGELFLAKADPSGWQLISQTKVTRGNAQHWAHLVISQGRLLVRHGNALIAFRIK